MENFFSYLVLPLLIMLVFGVLWTMLMRCLGNVLCRITRWHPLVVASTANAISIVIGRLVLIAIWWTVAYVVFEVLL